MYNYKTTEKKNAGKFELIKCVHVFQSDWIRQNCAVQMERVRDNYNFQVQNLRDIRQYGSTHVTAVRDQYYEQV